MHESINNGRIAFTDPHAKTAHTDLKSFVIGRVKSMLAHCARARLCLIGFGQQDAFQSERRSCLARLNACVILRSVSSNREQADDDNGTMFLRGDAVGFRRRGDLGLLLPLR